MVGALNLIQGWIEKVIFNVVLNIFIIFIELLFMFLIIFVMIFCLFVKKKFKHAYLM